jgi:hypothetical protein
MIDNAYNFVSLAFYIAATVPESSTGGGSTTIILEYRYFEQIISKQTPCLDSRAGFSCNRLFNSSVVK